MVSTVHNMCVCVCVCVCVHVLHVDGTGAEEGGGEDEQRGTWGHWQIPAAVGENPASVQCQVPWRGLHHHPCGEMPVFSSWLPIEISVSIRVYCHGGFKLEDTECSTVVHQACTEFCSRHQRLNFYYKNAGLFFQTKQLLSVFRITQQQRPE